MSDEFVVGATQWLRHVIAVSGTDAQRDFPSVPETAIMPLPPLPPLPPRDRSAELAVADPHVGAPPDDDQLS